MVKWNIAWLHNRNKKRRGFMKVGIIGLGRMGEGMSRRLIKAGHEVWGYRNNYAKAEEQYEKGYISGCTTSVESLVQVVRSTPSDRRAPGIFMMVVPAETVEGTINELLQFCVEGDIIIDHGNSNFKDTRRRAERLAKLGIQYIDCGRNNMSFHKLTRSVNKALFIYYMAVLLH